MAKTPEKQTRTGEQTRVYKKDHAANKGAPREERGRVEKPKPSSTKKEK